jgi:hypothetical protein
MSPNAGPAPHADKLSNRRTFFMLFGGPAAWLLQLFLSVPLSSWPCFPQADRLAGPLAGYGWTRFGVIVIMLGCVGLAAAAGWSSLTKLRETADEKPGSHSALIEIGHGRTRFTALWGVILGFGFTLACALTVIPLVLVPRCAS